MRSMQNIHVHSITYYQVLTQKSILPFWLANVKKNIYSIQYKKRIVFSGTGLTQRTSFLQRIFCVIV